MARGPQNLELEEELRGYLQQARETGFTRKVIIQQMEKAGLTIASNAEDLRNFERDVGRHLDSDDAKKMRRFFIEHQFGLSMRSKIAAVDEATHRSAAPKTTPILIGPVGTPKPEVLTGNIRLASISIEGAQWGQGSVFASVTVACPDWERCAVQRGRIVMDPNPGMLTQSAESAWSKTRFFTTQRSDKSGRVTVQLGCSTRYDPFWEVMALNQPIGKFSTDGDFAPLEGLSPGNSVTVTFGTWLGDIADTGSGTDEEMVATDALIVVANHERETPFDDPRGYKRRLISLIRRSALDAGPDGYVKLSRCVLRIGER